MESLFSPDEVLAQLTLDEKISLLSGKSMWSLRDIPRLKVPSIRVSDGPQGLRKAVTEITALESFPATCFPTACALACSWNTTLMHQVGQALAEECRDQNVQVLLGPGLNIRRHVCGGRNFEYFSEDPIVSGHLAAALVQGIQFSGSVGACVKHVCVNNQESWRFRVNVLVDERTLREVYLKGFEYVVKNAQPWSLMCAYNQLNGIYCSENARLFQDIVRREWGFNGLVMTDWGATNRRVAGIQAGVDLEMPGTYGIHKEPIQIALKDNTLTHQQLNDAVLRNLQLIHRAARGMPAANNNNDNSLASIQQELYKNHHEMAFQAALECIVLLQNTDSLLPLPLTRSSQQSQQSNQTSTKVALIGDFCQDPRYQGMGSSKVNSTRVDTVLEHISKYTDNYVYSRGYLNSDDNDDNAITSRWTMREQDNVASQREALIQEAVDNAKNADVVILLTGVPEIHESEGFDRQDIYLPAHHNELIHRVCEVNPNVIVVLSNGGPVLMPWKDNVKAICECYLLGQAGARALLDVLFGVVSPSGKLTETFPTSLETVPSNLYFPGNSHTVEYREGLQVGYRYYDTANIPVLFPFGHGLSYTSFEYTKCSCNVMMNPTTTTTTTTTKAALVQVECCITNVGKMVGAEIVQLYVHQNASQVYQPEQQLRDFAKTKILQPGESETIVFTLTKDAFAFFDVGVSDWIMEEGATYEIRLAASSRDIRWTGTITCNDIAKSLGGSGGGDVRICQPSQDACTSHPPLRNKQSLAAPLTIDDAAFHAMLDTHPFDLMFLSSRSLLGQHVPGEAANPAAVETAAAAVAGSSPSRRPLVATPVVMTQVLPHEIDVIHRNSFLSEIERNGCFGNLFAKIIMKAMETEMEDPNDPKQKKMIREVARNLPLRCLATFSRGNMSFDLLDSLIALFNGHYAGAISHLSSSSRKAATSLIGRR